MKAVDHITAGTNYLNQNKFDEAIDEFTKALAQEPSSAEAYGERGRAYLESKKQELAIADLNMAISLSLNKAVYYTNRGIAYYYTNAWDKALLDLNKSITLKSTDCKAYYYRAEVYIKLERWQEAIADFDEGIKQDLLDETKAMAYCSRGLACFNQNNDNAAQAILDFIKAIDLNPSYTNAYYSRGMVYKKQKKFALSLSDFDQVIRFDKTYTKAYLARGRIYQKQGKITLALDEYARVLELNPKAPDLYYNRGFLYHGQGMLIQAIEEYSKALALDSNNLLAYYNRSLAYYDLGQQVQASADFSQFLVLSESTKVGFASDSVLAYSGDTGLHIAVKNQDERMLAFFLKQNINQSIKNKQGHTAIEIACELGFGNMVKGLTADKISKEVHPVTSPHYESALLIAIKKSHYTNVQALLECNTNCERSDSDSKGNVAIYEALCNDNVQILELLLAQLKPSNLGANKEGLSLVGMAQKLGAEASLQYLLNQFTPSYLQIELLLEMKNALPPTLTFGLFRSNHINFIEVQLRDLNIQNQVAVNGVFNAIESTLNHLKLMTRDEETLSFDKTFQTKFQNTRRLLNEIKAYFGPVMNTVLPVYPIITLPQETNYSCYPITSNASSQIPIYVHYPQRFFTRNEEEINSETMGSFSRLF